MEIVEHAEALGAREIDAHFLERFADRGRQEVRIGGLAPAAGKCDLSLPHVADANRALDEQGFDAFVAIAQDNGDGRGNHPGLERNLSGSIVS